MLSRLQELPGMLVIFGVILILGIMIVPLPTSMLDLFLALNIALALLILVSAMYITEPLQFSVFPGLLLLITLFRLSLNIATTRLILGDAYAGQIIETFGQFVVKGNYVVGFIIFLILVIINFIVITKGAERVAEVSARFTLDAMPGKQMSIDADLNAGLIDEREAKTRREKISREADFFGAMDGASKFVRGDAIAGLIITMINIIGGLIIGAVQNNMGVGEALQTYTLLTVGDGLVSQIPAIVISTAAGIVITRNASDSKDNLGQTIVRQFTANPQALIAAAVIILIFGFTPGFPTFPFLMISAGVGVVAVRKFRQPPPHELLPEEEEEEAEQLPPAENIKAYLQVDPLEIEIGYGLISLVDESQGGDLLDRITSLRRQVATELGVMVPPIRIRDNLQLSSNQYRVLVRGTPATEAELMPGYLMALDPGTVTQKIDGIETVEPTFEMPAVWITENQQDRAEQRGYTVVEAEAVLATHLMEIVKQHAHELLTRQEVQNLLDAVKEEHPTVIDELVPNTLSVGGVQKVLQSLLQEKIPIKNLVQILEALADYAPQTKDPQALLEFVRGSLSDVICNEFKAPDGKLYCATLEPTLEQNLSDSIRNGQMETMGTLGLTPDQVQELYDRITEVKDRMNAEGYQPLILCSPTLRPYFRMLIEPEFPDVVVMSYGELTMQIEVEAIGMVELS
ncbi:MAG: flagellar biosynthesis protein FlhA [Candidatus Marinimicrobia bacterium]|nr:flagellar biosynthesis protein FlhA [Candidatus Neomarinimicrobiota bacterium]MCF7880517.1 flagellar biosynthesis protein FlhA [Candidatus Neomarinimicrobiota bacterium]